MSHFSVMVIGDGVDDQLYPYSELDMSYEELKHEELKHDSRASFVVEVEAGEIEKYIKDQVLPKVRDEALKQEYKTRFDAGDYEDILEDWCGGIKNDSGDWGYYQNPISKWDWYIIGGRWRGSLKLKDGKEGYAGNPSQSGVFGNMPVDDSWVDSAVKQDINFKFMADKSEELAKDRYLRVERLMGGKIPVVKSIESYREPQRDWSQMQYLYGKQSAVKKFKEILSRDSKLSEKDLLALSGVSLDDFQVSLERFIEIARRKSVSTFAILKDGEWFEKGSMGWFGVSSNDKEEGLWVDQFHSILDSVGDDELITVVDCHV